MSLAVSKKRRLDTLFLPGPASRMPPHSAAMLDDILRAGIPQLNELLRSGDAAAMKVGGDVGVKCVSPGGEGSAQLGQELPWYKYCVGCTKSRVK